MVKSLPLVTAGWSATSPAIHQRCERCCSRFIERVTGTYFGAPVVPEVTAKSSTGSSTRTPGAPARIRSISGRKSS